MTLRGLSRRFRRLPGDEAPWGVFKALSRHGLLNLVDWLRLGIEYSFSIQIRFLHQRSPTIEVL